MKTLTTALGILSLFYLFSCTNFNAGQESEPPAANDAEPPADYNPVFVNKIKQFNENEYYQPKAILSSVDARNPNSVKLRFHILDKDNAYLAGLTNKKYQKYWCEIVDSFRTKVINIKKPKIYEYAENDNKKTYLAIVLDHSGSIGEERANTVQNAISELIQTKKDGDEIALIKYDNRIQTEVPLTNSKDELTGKFQKTGLTNFGGMTAINDGILQGIKEFNGLHRSDDKAVLVFTDGWDNSSTVRKDSLINIARKNNILICGIDFGENIYKDYMKQYTDSTSGIYHHIYRTNEFNMVFDDLYKRLKNSYVIEYNPTDYGYHKLKIRMCFPYDTLEAYASFDNTPDIGSMGLLNIYFDFNKSTIQKESEEAITGIYTLLKAYPGMIIELRGHTDSLNSTNDPEYNIKLSRKRADAVKQILIKKGIQRDRIFTKGLGDTEPVATNETEEGRASNRRTEFVILRK